ncbi:hypothetical protein EON65_03215 [archaeon]|nr:MAG: hypothetical protein EON65_03215 [archaeon]
MLLYFFSYHRKKEVEVLSERYNVPRHIAIVMGFASDGVKYPDIVDQWSFAKRLHRGVKKALYHSM